MQTAENNEIAYELMQTPCRILYGLDMTHFICFIDLMLMKDIDIYIFRTKMWCNPVNFNSLFGS